MADLEPTAALSGRKQQAARNDQVILEAAREVFLEDPGAPIAAVATQANVGISALYRRYPSKEDLLRKLCHDGLLLMIAESEAAALQSDPWDAFVDFLYRVVDADVHSLTIHLAGTFTPTAEMRTDAIRASQLGKTLFENAQSVGKIRADAVIGDVELILQSCASIRTPNQKRSKELRRRLLALQIDGLANAGPAELPGPPPGSEMGWRWRQR